MEVWHETEKRSADHAPAHAGAVRQHRGKSGNSPDAGGRICACGGSAAQSSGDGLKEITHELKGIGRSINQLVVLCNMGRIKEVHLDDAWQTLSQVYLKLRELAEQERT